MKLQRSVPDWVGLLARIQVVHTHVPLSPSSIIWYRPTGSDAMTCQCHDLCLSSVLSTSEGPWAWEDNADRYRWQVPLPVVRQADRSQQPDWVRLRPRLPADRPGHGNMRPGHGNMRPSSVETAWRAYVRSQDTSGHGARQEFFCLQQRYSS